MIKRIALLLAALLLFGTAAYAAGADEGRLLAGIDEEGGLIIQVTTGEGDAGEWVADEPEAESAVVRIVDETSEEGLFSVRYEAGEDGEATVYIYHYEGIACDELHGFDVTVEGGAVTAYEETVRAESPDEALADEVFSGEWYEAETGLASMTIAKAEKGWDVTIRSAVDEGEHAFTAVVFYDCEKDGLVYDNGAIAPASGEGQEVVADEIGVLRITDAGYGRIGLVWRAPLDGREVTFIREDAISATDWTYRTFEETGIRMTVPADFEDSAEKDPEAIFDMGNAFVAMKVLPIGGTFDGIFELADRAAAEEGVSLAMTSDVNGLYLVYIEAQDGSWFAVDALGKDGAAARFLFTVADPEGYSVAWLMIDSMEIAG